MRTVYNDGDDLAYLEHQGVVEDRPLAACYLIKGRRVWFPKRLIKDSSDELVAVPKWMAESKDLKSDW